MENNRDEVGIKMLLNSSFMASAQWLSSLCCFYKKYFSKLSEAPIDVTPLHPVTQIAAGT